MAKAKIKVGVLCGGNSGEHEISLISAKSVMRNLDSNLFEIIPIGIDKSGHWFQLNLREILANSNKSVVIERSQPIQFERDLSLEKIDIIFPVMHGPLCEDGTLQGFLETLGLPYVGCGVVASSVGMDKDVAKRLAAQAGIPVVPWVCLRAKTWSKQWPQTVAQIEKDWGYPVFVKPSNMGSSVGVHKAKNQDDLKKYLIDAFRYDTKVLVEKAISAREIEYAVLENGEDPTAPFVSIGGEIAPTHEFYSYESKYIDENGAVASIPAAIGEAKLNEGADWARKTFVALEGEGLSRVDFFLDKGTGQFYLNEVNTLPGFTSISMYPKLWEASGIGYSALLTRLIELGLARGKVKRELLREWKG